jgi:hypothetical protein
MINFYTIETYREKLKKLNKKVVRQKPKIVSDTILITKYKKAYIQKNILPSKNINTRYVNVTNDGYVITLTFVDEPTYKTRKASEMVGSLAVPIGETLNELQIKPTKSHKIKYEWVSDTSLSFDIGVLKCKN